jgi:hypothetical protein
LGIRRKTTGEKIGGALGGVAGGIAGGSTGGMLGGLAAGALISATGVGAAVGIPLMLASVLGGGALGSWAGGSAGEMGGEWLGSKFATGGVVDKPTRALVGESGPEAVVPLNSGTHVPVTFQGSGLSDLSSKMDSLISTMATQNKLHEEAVSHMRDTKDLTQKLLNVTM